MSLVHSIDVFGLVFVFLFRGELLANPSRCRDILLNPKFHRVLREKVLSFSLRKLSCLTPLILAGILGLRL